MWNEKQALQEIICELSEASGPEKKSSRSKTFREAITFSKLHYAEAVEVQHSIDAEDILSTTYFDVEYVQRNFDMIQQLVEMENLELERNIDDLQKIINGEEVVSSHLSSLSISPRGSHDASSGRAVSGHAQAKMGGKGDPFGNTKARTIGTIKKMAKSTTPNRDDIGSSYILDQSNDSVLHNVQNNNQSKSCETSPNIRQQNTNVDGSNTPPRGGKLRGRLRDAQAELFFADYLDR